MRILAITHQYIRLGNDSIAPYNRQQLRSMAEDHDIEVVAPIPWTASIGSGYRSVFAGADCYRNKDGIWVHHPLYWYPPKLLMHRYGQYFLSSIRKTVGQIIDRFRPEAIFSCWAHPDGWAAVKLGREHGVPVLIKVIGSDVLVLARDPRRREKIAEALNEADGVAAVSNDLAEHVISLGVARSRVHVVPEGIDHDLFCPGDQAAARGRLRLENDGHSQLLFVGNLLFSKGAGVLLEACALLKKKGVNFRCHLVGKGSDALKLRALSEKLGLDQPNGGMVSFAGPCPQWQLPDWYRSCDLVVLPSFSEGIPNVLREGMMCGKAFVATSVGGIPEITRPEVGRVVQAGNPHQLAEAIENALANRLGADRKVALELNLSWKQSAQLMIEQLMRIRQDAPNVASERQKLAVPSVATEPIALEDGKQGLRILAVTQIYPRARSSTAGSYNYNQFQALNQAQSVSVISPTSWTDFPAGWFAHGRAVELPRDATERQIPVDRPTFFFPPKVFRSSHGLFYYESIRRRFHRVVREFKPDVVLACWSHPDGWAAVLLARKHGLPVIIKVHGSDVLVLGKSPRRRKRVIEALREADEVAAVSQDLANQVIGLGVEPSRVHVVPHGVDPVVFCPGDQAAARARLNLPATDVATLLFVGNLLISKGTGVLLKACGLLRQKNVRFCCHLVGKGLDEPTLRALAKRLGLDGDLIKFEGSCPQQQLPDWYRASDLVVLPSFSEGIPNVLREAMMCGTAFVATDVGGIPEITRPEVGRLVKAGNAAALSDAIEHALSEGLKADRETALKLNVSWEQSAKMMLIRLKSLQKASHSSAMDR